MADNLLDRIGTLLRRRPWYELPRFLAMPRLIEMRNTLREKNLHDTEEPPFVREEIPPDLDPRLRDERTLDGTHNDLHHPRMGCVGARFGRNFPLEHVFPATADRLTPSPRLVSRELMTRDEFRPATTLNLMAAAWIQFMVHDWFVHDTDVAGDRIDIPLPPGDDWPTGSMSVGRTVVDPAPAGSTRPPAFTNQNSHWWDASQVYGTSRPLAARLRSGEGGRLKVDASGLLPVDPDTGIDFTGFSDNWWVGLAMLHTLFTREHNHICDQLAALQPSWTDDQLYGKAKLINSALLAKIHTLEWTCAIVTHPVVKIAMKANWSGVLGEDLQEVLEFLDDQEILGGIVGSSADHHAAPYSLTEEFVAVYRMHPLIPDEVIFRSLADDTILERQELPALAGKKTRALVSRVSMPDLFYSFGVSHPGAITLHNYPKHLQNLERDNGERFDLAAVDILRDRERGVPRYNQFRRLLGKDPVRSFDELTDNAEWRQQLHRVYAGDLEKVDLMTGLFAEPLPPGFGFSETAFRIFVLMASRRLKSDRFFTDDYRKEVYTEFGIDYIRQNSMLTLLMRHYPALAPALVGVENVFAPWRRLGV
ncbi:MAG TPA: peroxidase family protein [Vicinamibacterales bacterium]|nr:peroxidase family protein [Vicinamibacterales bacterium]